MTKAWPARACGVCGKQVFVGGDHQVEISVPFRPLFLHEKPGRIERVCEYPHLEVFRTMLVGYRIVGHDQPKRPATHYNKSMNTLQPSKSLNR